MRGWSKQGFLNPASSNDDGWYKFSVRPGKGSRYIDMSIQYIISDCSNKAYLEFSPSSVAINDDGSVMRKSDAKEAIVDAKERIKKIRKFNNAVAESAVKIEDALEQFIADVETALDKGWSE